MRRKEREEKATSLMGPVPSIHPFKSSAIYNKLCGGFEDMFLRPSASVLIEKDKAIAASTGTLRYVTPLKRKLLLLLPYGHRQK